MNEQTVGSASSDYTVCWMDNSLEGMPFDAIRDDLKGTANRGRGRALVSLHFPLHLQLKSLEGEGAERLYAWSLLTGEMKRSAERFSSVFLDEWTDFSGLGDRPNPFRVKGLDLGFIPRNELGSFLFENALKSLLCKAVLETLRPRHLRLYCTEKNSFFVGKETARQMGVSVSRFGEAPTPERRLWDFPHDGHSAPVSKQVLKGMGFLGAFGAFKGGGERKYRLTAFSTGPGAASILGRAKDSGRFDVTVLTTYADGGPLSGKPGFRSQRMPKLSRDSRSKSYRERELRRFWHEPEVRAQIRRKCMLEGLDLWPVLEKALSWLALKAYPEIFYTAHALKESWAEKPPDLTAAAAGEGWAANTLCAAAIEERIPFVQFDMAPGDAPAGWGWAPASRYFLWMDPTEDSGSVGSDEVNRLIAKAPARGKSEAGPVRVLFAPSSGRARTRSGCHQETALILFQRLRRVAARRGAELVVVPTGARQSRQFRELPAEPGRSPRFESAGRFEALLGSCGLMVTNGPGPAWAGLFAGCPVLFYAPGGDGAPGCGEFRFPFCFESESELDSLTGRFVADRAALMEEWNAARERWLSSYRAATVEDPVGHVAEEMAGLASAAMKRRRKA